jgi:hypothetical protein
MGTWRHHRRYRGQWVVRWTQEFFDGGGVRGCRHPFLLWSFLLLIEVLTDHVEVVVRKANFRYPRFLRSEDLCGF